MSGLDKDRKRNQTVCFRMTPEERRELEARITVSGLPKGKYFIQSVLYQEVKIAVGKYQSDRLSLEIRRLCTQFNGKIHKIDPTVGYVCHTETLISKEFRVSEEFPLSALRAQNANTFLSLRLGITDTCLQQIIRVSVSLHGAGYP